MDTLTDITLVVRSTTDLAPTWRAIDSILLYWEEHFSVEQPSSEVRALNESRDSVVAVSAQLADMVRRAIALGDSLGGSFDITILPLKRLWGLDEISVQDSTHRFPSAHELAEALTLVDYRSVKVDTVALTIRRPPGVFIDVGGIAKGGAIRETARYLDSQGFADFLVSSGGDILARGHRKDGTAWVIGIQHPRADSLLATVRVDSGCTYTSGDYERYWLAPDGRRVHHIFDPTEGRSCVRNQSVTVWCMDPVEADVLTTGLFCRPADSIVAWVERNPSHECLVVDSAGAVFVSRGWTDRIVRR